MVGCHHGTVRLPDNRNAFDPKAFDRIQTARQPAPDAAILRAKAFYLIAVINGLPEHFENAASLADVRGKPIAGELKPARRFALQSAQKLKCVFLVPFADMVMNNEFADLRHSQKGELISSHSVVGCGYRVLSSNRCRDRTASNFRRF